MSYGNEAADQAVRLTLDGVEIAAKLTGKAAERLAKLIYSIIKDQKRTKGKMRLSSMIRTGKPMKIFAINDENVMKFCKEAKKYGVMFCVLKDTDAGDGLTDIMIREEDVGKVNRIFERFDLAVVDMGGLRSDIEDSREQAQHEEEKEEPEQKDIGEKQADGEDVSDTGSHSEKQNPEAVLEAEAGSVPGAVLEYTQMRSERINEFLNRIGGAAKNEPEKEVAENPTDARTEKSPQSGPSSEMSRSREGNGPKAGEGRSINAAEKRPSVKKELEKLREEKDSVKPVFKENVHIEPKKKKRERGRQHGHVRE